MDQEAVETLKKYRAMVLEAIESLLGPNLSKEDVKEACTHLDVTSFSDATEERALVNVCGYPICTSKLEPKKWQQYLIRGRKVYDTTERRRFCSDKCYERYVHIAIQLPEEPLWFRGLKPDAEPFRLSFLEDDAEHKSNGLPGREVELKLVESMERMKLNDSENGASPSASASDSSTPSQQKNHLLTNVKAGVSDQVAVLLSKVIRDESSDDDQNADDSEGEYPFREHIDCEESAVGNWQPSRSKNQTKPVQKIPPRRPIMIDPLPMPPVSKKRGK